MPKTITTRNQEVFAQPVESLTTQFVQSLNNKTPYDSIIDFAAHRSFCGMRLFPRQKTLLKLIYLETENMTAYDLDVIEQWRTSFTGGKDSYGIQPDVWERIEYLKSHGYRHFPHVQAVMGRRASKGVIGGVLGAETMAHLVSLDDWQAHYGIARNKDCYLNVIATNSIQAKKNQFADIRSTVESCEYLKKYISSDKEYYLSLRTPADLRLLAEMQSRRIPLEHEIASVRCLAVSSTSSSGRGSVSAANFFDEFAHMLTGTGGPRSSEQVYSAYQPSLDDFGKDSLTYMPSSPYTKIGYFYELYVAGCVLLPEYLSKHSALDPALIRHNAPVKSSEDTEIEDLEAAPDLLADPELLIVQLPSWDLYKDFELSPKLGGPKFKRALQVYDERMQRLERRNPTKFKVEKKAQFAEVEDAYLDPDKVDQMFDPLWWNQSRTLAQAEFGTMAYVYEGHVDPSKVNANFAVTIAHLEQAPADEHGDVWSHVIIDHMHVWKPSDYPDHTVDYVEITKYLAELIKKYPALKEFTFDAWNSAGPIAQLREIFPRRPRIRVEEFSEKNNTKRAEYFKSAINLGWIHSFKDTFYGEGQSLLEQELKFLIEKNGKIEKQTIGPVTTKDLADTVMETSYRLLHHQLDQHEKSLMGKMKMGKGMPGGQIDPLNHPSLTPQLLSQIGPARSRGFTTGGPGAARERLQARREQIHDRRRRGISGFGRK